MMKTRNRIDRHRLFTLAWVMGAIVVSFLSAGQEPAWAASDTKKKAVDLSIEAIDHYYESGLYEVRRAFYGDFKRALPVWETGDDPDQG